MKDALQRVAGYYGGAVTVTDGAVVVSDARRLRTDATDRVVWDAVFGDSSARDAARWLLWELGQAVGCRPASINALYLARGWLGLLLRFGRFPKAGS